MRKNWEVIFGPGEWKRNKHGGLFYARDNKPQYPIRLHDALDTYLHSDSLIRIHDVDVYDVTEDYKRESRPGYGKLIIQSGTSKFIPHTHKVSSEYIQARWLIDTFGGDVTLVRPNSGSKYYQHPKGDLCPDFIWKSKRVEYWELKELTPSKKASHPLDTD